MYLNCISLTLVFATNLSAQLNLEKNLTDHRESREYESYFKLQQVELTVVNKGLAIYSETIEGLQLRTNCNAANS